MMNVFVDHCKQHKIDADLFFCRKVTNAKVRDRLSFTLSRRSIEIEQMKMLVVYFPAFNVFAGWNLHTPPYRERIGFSVDRRKALAAVLSREYATVLKHLGHPGRGVELVHIFTESGIDEFLKSFQASLNS